MVVGGRFPLVVKVIIVVEVNFSLYLLEILVVVAEVVLNHLLFDPSVRG